MITELGTKPDQGDGAGQTKQLHELMAANQGPDADRTLPHQEALAPVEGCHEVAHHRMLKFGAVGGLRAIVNV